MKEDIFIRYIPNGIAVDYYVSNLELLHGGKWTGRTDFFTTNTIKEGK